MDNGESSPSAVPLEALVHRPQEGDSVKERSASIDLKEFAAKHHVIVAHGINPDSYVAGNSALMAEASNFQTKLAVTLALEPTIATSSLRVGDSERNVWNGVGVILSGGQIIDAHAHDAGSVASGLHERSTHPGLKKEVLEEKLRTAANPDAGARSWSGYNEIIVDNPKVAGLYVVNDELQENSTQINIPIEVEQASEHFGLPLFVISHGQAYAVRRYEDRIIMGEPLSPEQLSASMFTLDKTTRESMIAQLLEQGVFKGDPRERVLVAEHQSGRAAYLREYAHYDPDQLEQRPRVSLSDGSSGRLVGECNRSYANGISFHDRFVMTPDGLQVDRTSYGQSFFQGNKPEAIVMRSSNLGRDFPIPPLAGDAWNHYFESTSDHGSDYLGLMNETITTVQAYLTEIDQGKNPHPNVSGSGSNEGLKRWLEEAAFNLYGIADEANQHNDSKVVQRAASLASPLLARETYDALLAKRFNAKGNFRSVPEDLIKEK
jgi:hypothetical protein